MPKGEFSRLLSAIEARKSNFADLLQRANTIFDHPPQSVSVTMNTTDLSSQQHGPWNSTSRMRMTASGVPDRFEGACQPGTIDPAVLSLDRSHEYGQVESGAGSFAEWNFYDGMQTDHGPI